MQIKERLKGAIYGWKHGAEYDTLTGLHTRSFFEYELWFDESQRAKRYGHSLSIVLLDMDGLKSINDSMGGHAAGDRALRGLSAGIIRQIRPSDTLIRYGGDEFLLILPETDSIQARMLMDKIQEHMPEAIRFSFGVAEWREDFTLEMLCQEADDELLEEKRQKYSFVDERGDTIQEEREQRIRELITNYLAVGFQISRTDAGRIIDETEEAYKQRG